MIFTGKIRIGSMYDRRVDYTGEPPLTVKRIEDGKIYFVRVGFLEEVWQTELEFRQNYVPQPKLLIRKGRRFKARV